MVASTVASSRSAEICLGRPLRGRSSSTAAKPRLSNRLRHSNTVGKEVEEVPCQNVIGNSLGRAKDNADAENNSSGCAAMTANLQQLLAI